MACATFQALSNSSTSLFSESQAGALWEDLNSELTRLEPRIIEFRRHLHAHPELSLQEVGTSACIAQELAEEGVPHRFGTGKRGVMVDLGPALSENKIGLRADCDALPIQEENSVPYASKNPGVMHACGHDAHSAMLLGALLALHRTHCPLPVRGIFQPAEEAGDGALGMIADGALAGLKSIVALHVDPNLQAGQAAAVTGPQTAHCQDFHINVTGRGGHAARPHLGIDPIAMTASLITQLYQAIPRGIDSRKPVVLSICQIRGGHATNVIPDHAELGGTIRALDADSARVAKETLERVCRGVGESFGGTILCHFKRGIPGVVNDPSVTAACVLGATDVLGKRAVLSSGEPSLGAEDFADYLQQIPGCMMRLGVRTEGRAVTPLHTPTFDIDERALILGSKLLLRSALELGRT